MKLVIHSLLKMWKTVEKPVNKGVLSIESVENHVENVDESGKHASRMHTDVPGFIHAQVGNRSIFYEY